MGTLVIDINQPILFVADEGKEEEVVKRLARVGYDNIWLFKGRMKSLVSRRKRS